MTHFQVTCTKCNAILLPDMTNFLCNVCASTLQVTYPDPDYLCAQPPGWSGPHIPTPIHDIDSYVSLGEGNTPLIPLPRLGDSLGLSHLSAKLEFLNPTGSYKDRGTATMISVAHELGVKEIIEDSSGNAGASVSAYSARAGIKAHIFAPQNAPQAKIAQIIVYGAEPHLVPGPREFTTTAALDYVRRKNITYASHNLSPFFVEGTKSFAYEVFMQMKHNMPDHIVIPVGNGSLYLGAWKGFMELKEKGHLEKIPKLHCIQAKAVMPIVSEINGQDWTPGNNVTVAGGISSATPPHKEAIIDVLRRSNGTAAAVEEKAIISHQKKLADLEGIYAEPTSSAAFAGLSELMEIGRISSEDHVLLPVTGFGLKDNPPI